MTTTTTTRAIVQTGYGTSETWRLGDVPMPTPGRGEVLLAVSAAGIDRGTWHLMTGLPRLLRLGLGLRTPRRRVPGLDVAGTVVATGPDVTGFEPGQAVFGVAAGSFAEHAVAKATKLAQAPSGLATEQAAVLGISGMTALQALDAARVAAGDRVLVIGASGGVGSFVVTIAAQRGCDVTAVCSGAKASTVRGWGAERVIDRTTEDATAGDDTYDAIIDIAGGTPLRRLRRILSSTGTIVFVGDDTGGPWTGGYGRPMRHALRMLPARQRYVMLASAERGTDLERLATLVDEGLRPHVHATYPLAHAREAMDELLSGRTTGKIAVTVAAG